MFTSNKIKKLGIALVALLIAILPLIPQSVIGLGMMVFIGLQTIVVVGMVLLMGFAGQISLGHAAFYGLGAYTTMFLTVKLGLSPILGVIGAAVLTGIVAAVIGKPTLKLKEHYLALATLGFGSVIYILFNEGGEITGGPSGVFGIPPIGIGSFLINNDFKFYYLTWIFVGIVMLLAHNIVNSRVGRALQAIHSSEVAAEAMGVDTAKYKLQVFVFSAVLAGIAGSLYAHYVSFISPSPFSFKISVEFMLMAVVGGLGSIWGPIFGVALVVILSEMLKSYLPLILPQAGGEFEIIIFGIILVLVMIFLPNGLTSLKDVLREKFHKRVVEPEVKAPNLREGKVEI